MALGVASPLGLGTWGREVLGAEAFERLVGIPLEQGGWAWSGIGGWAWIVIGGWAWKVWIWGLVWVGILEGWGLRVLRCRDRPGLVSDP